MTQTAPLPVSANIENDDDLNFEQLKESWEEWKTQQIQQKQQNLKEKDKEWGKNKALPNKTKKREKGEDGGVGAGAGDSDPLCASLSVSVSGDTTSSTSDQGELDVDAIISNLKASEKCLQQIVLEKEELLSSRSKTWNSEKTVLETKLNTAEDKVLDLVFKMKSQTSIAKATERFERYESVIKGINTELKVHKHALEEAQLALTSTKGMYVNMLSY